jgi:hypothetical protein
MNKENDSASHVLLKNTSHKNVKPYHIETLEKYERCPPSNVNFALVGIYESRDEAHAAMIADAGDIEPVYMLDRDGKVHCEKCGSCDAKVLFPENDETLPTFSICFDCKLVWPFKGTLKDDGIVYRCL